MVDFETQSRLYGYKYNAPERTQPIATKREVCSYVAPYVFKEARTQAHECGKPYLQKATKDWEAYVMAHGIGESMENMQELQHQERSTPTEMRPPPKLLKILGESSGSSKQGCFNFPRSVSVGTTGDIFIADTKNHRIQQFNQCGIQKNVFGSRGNNIGELCEPTGLTVFGNNKIAVADKGNKRIQVFEEAGGSRMCQSYKPTSQFQTKGTPHFVASDFNENLLVSTTSGFIECYDRTGALRSIFHVSGNAIGDGRKMAPPITVNNKEEVIVSDTLSKTIKYFTYQGQLIYEFMPMSSLTGVCCEPEGIAVTPTGSLIVVDSLNHVINQYSEDGHFEQQLLSSADGVGSAHAIALGPEGHLLICEYAATGKHFVKVFSCTPCNCHTKRGTMK